jgi:hypothetical protein
VKRARGFYRKLVLASRRTCSRLGSRTLWLKARRGRAPMQPEPYGCLRVCVFFTAGSLLGGGLVRLPLAPDGKASLCLLARFAATPFLGKTLLGKTFVLRYFAAWPAVAGAGGLIWQVADRLEPKVGHSGHLRVGRRPVSVAGACYLRQLMTGRLISRHIRRGAD